MQFFTCVVLLAAAAVAALAAPEGAREKRGFLGGALAYGHYDHELDHYGHEHDHYDDYHLSGLASLAHAALHDHAPARIVTKIVEVPKVVEVRKVVSVPRVVKYARVVDPHVHYSYARAPLAAPWW